MSYNSDLLNYSIGVNEYLFKYGFNNILVVKYFTGSGKVLLNNEIPLRPVHYQKNHINHEHIKKVLIKNYKKFLINIFATHEPNFYHKKYLVENTNELRGDYQISHCQIKDHNKNIYKIILISDFNHNNLQNYIHNNYKNVSIVYFFFQGYLAVQWYRQYKLFKPFTNKNFEFKYNCMSRIIDTMRVYRLYLTSILSEYNLLKYGQISCSYECPYTKNTIHEILSDNYCFLNRDQQEHVKTHLINKLPLRFDKYEYKQIPNTSYEIDLIEMSKSFLHVVNETVFYESFNHLTEKIFKPIVCMRPFILTSTPGSLKYLRRYGFKTFNKWIDESYDQEHDQHKRLNMIASEIRKICLLNKKEISNMYTEMLPVLKHNYDLFFGSFEQDILDELVKNYGSAVI